MIPAVVDALAKISCKIKFFPPGLSAKSMLRGVLPSTSSAPEVFEPIRRQLGVANRVLDISMAEIGLQGAVSCPLLARAKPQAWRSMCG